MFARSLLNRSKTTMLRRATDPQQANEAQRSGPNWAACSAAIAVVAGGYFAYTAMGAGHGTREIYLY
ncbi:hypothetical protein BCR43DRAFT_487584 [Syncephalastrum racemosum]|uniref:Uncharacterized protein n=1 Tax=Syncephalastrum racemosum TaxID=13706 RepID=A0A1X2HHA5_SYNRA|nr:hypothetical protein BCR43DRAFT_487584 [Syncephalastrum racemosum]